MKFLISIFIILGFSSIEQDKSFEIAHKIDERAQPQQMSANLALMYKDKSGKILQTRNLYYRRVWRKVESESVLLKFMNPEEIRNCSFLSVAEEKNSKQLFYMPDLGGPMTIKGNKLNNPFMNSDFHFGDLISWSIVKNKNRLISESDETIIIESIVEKAWFNMRLEITINKKNLFIKKVEYYENSCPHPTREMQILKSIDLEEFIIPTHILMTSFKGCSQEVISSSEILYSNIDIHTPINPDVFTEEFMSDHEF